MANYKPLSTEPDMPPPSSPAPKMRKNRAPPVDFVELPLPKGYYQTEYSVTVPPRFQPGTSSLRYTAATLNWDEFATGNAEGKKPYTLRQAELQKTTKIMIIVTMYNEEVDLFVATMHNVYKNIEFLVDQKFEAGVNFDEIVVCIICDGRKKCPKEVKLALELLGTYQADELILTDFMEEPVHAHIFEHLSGSHIALRDKKTKDIRLEPSKYPTQYLLCMKEHNRKKIDSHGWAFKAFAPLLQPDVCILLDMGTKPEKESLYHLWMHFDGDKDLGGACGEIKVRVPGVNNYQKGFKLLSDPLLAAQNFEYKMSNILSKSLQSLFGYITVLPGAFSAYRYQALVGTPLDEYFAREKPTSDDADVSTWTAVTTANKYLAEDRILAFEIFTKAFEHWSLRYVKEAKANTDAPDELGQFFNQRRRWFNGSLFAYLSALFSINLIHRSSHTTLTKVGFYVEMIYLLIDLIFSLLAPMNFYCVLVIMWNMFAQTLGDAGQISTFFVIAIYGITFFFGMLVFIGNNPKGYASQWVYRMMSVIWGLCVIIVLALVVYNGVNTFRTASQEPSLTSIFKAFLYCIALLCSYGLYLLASAIFKDVAHIFSSMIGYLLFVPTQINMVLPFALANIHDVSWGTRAEEPEGRRLPKNKMVDGKAMMSGISTSDEHTIVVNTREIELHLNSVGSEADQEKAKKKNMSKKERETARRKARLATLEDRQKNVRMILLLAFLTCNLLGSVLITFFGVYKSNQAIKTKSEGNDVAFIYTTIIFGCIIVFSLIQFTGTVLFVMRTKHYKPKSLHELQEKAA
ncbi:Chitin synthase, class 1 [Nowakowskiella sp. JEL0407]|nr:Chitin synthase, class 1 [Nowakowskiella sp. JEL0407]